MNLQRIIAKFPKVKSGHKMQTFKYPFVSKILYRYGNFPVTFLLLLHFISASFLVQEQWYFALFAAFDLAIIIFLNRYYIRTYNFFPFRIEADSEKCVCTDFFMSNKKVEIRYKDISKISGGLFSGRPTKPIFIHDEKKGEKIGIYSHVNDMQKFFTVVLKNIDHSLYMDLMRDLENLKNKKARR